jgi:hypothetical protein
MKNGSPLAQEKIKGDQEEHQ